MTADQTQGFTPDSTSQAPSGEPRSRERQASPDARCYDPEDVLHSSLPYLIGVQDGWHAVRRTDALWCLEHDAILTAMCGALVRPAFKFGAYVRGAVPVSNDPCQVCAWTVAAETGALYSETGRLEPAGDARMALARLLAEPLIAAKTARAILDEAEQHGAPYGPDHPATIHLLAAVATHAPVILLPETCAEDSCDHGGGCPDGRAACMACSLQAGPWAGEWQGQSLEECTVYAPCSVLLALAEYTGTISRWPRLDGGSVPVLRQALWDCYGAAGADQDGMAECPPAGVLKPDVHDLAVEAVRELRGERDGASGRLAELENALTWNTSCTNCAAVLDSSIRDHERAERAEAKLAAVRQMAADLTKLAPSDDCGASVTDTVMADCGRGIVAVLDAAATEDGAGRHGETGELAVVDPGQVTVSREDLKVLLAWARNLADSEADPAVIRITAAVGGGE